jgi:hypothetical protein
VLLIAFICLQMLDALTTMVFLRFGVSEGNPLIRMALGASAQPAFALAAAKLLAVMLGLFAWRSGRAGLLRRMNLLFAVCVGWNIAAIASTVIRASA